ncbi:glutathione S-transferase [Decorospora gaudefroyi]|uniref:Glutathione S-transferase n=1 Tax=Decorospora gaudefroyi TaxID=184978 RepID=A0A6A5JWQ3_9PLEO|nr:glutathione S-transferase [Decorospora gaudefroyi]
MHRFYIRPLCNLHTSNIPKLTNPQLLPRSSRTYTATMASTKKAGTHPPYELLYWPDIPGRGEFIRLAFEARGVSYKDTANESEHGIDEVLSLLKREPPGDDGNPPVFAPPALRIPGEGKDGNALILYQTPAILAYLGDKLGLAGADEAEKVWVLSHTLTALDLNNEAHDTHHPVAISEYYESQREEALKKAKEFRENRIPKFSAFFERVLKGNEKSGQGKYLVGDSLTYADTTVWHVLSGLEYAFPKEMEARKKDYPMLFGVFYDTVKETKGIKEYLGSERRMPFSSGVFRRYPELDRQ